jgi:hypothetical protein
LELGKRACTKRDFDALMELYDVGEAQREELRELMIRGRQRVAPWWHAFSDVISANYAEFLTYEAEAAKCLEYQPLLIPGLLQTESYAEAITGPGFAPLGPDQVESLVEVKLRRQERLREETPIAFEAVITEAALRLQVGGPDVMRAQLNALPHVTLRIIPFEAGENGASPGAFVLFGVGNDTDADVAFMESVGGTTFNDDALTLRRLNRLHRNLAGAALSQEDSLELVERIKRETN